MNSPLDRRAFVAHVGLALASIPVSAMANEAGIALETRDDWGTSEAPVDVCIYGATSSGIVAAIAAKQRGMSVVVLEPTSHAGGLTTGGLGATDIGNKKAIGGLSREFYRRIGSYYEDEKAWRFEKRSDYRGVHQAAGEKTQWTFEPHAAMDVYREWLAEHGLVVHLNEQLLDENRKQEAVTREGNRIRSVRLKSGKEVFARFFIDSTYEADLAAAAECTTFIGREANRVYDESLNGVQVAQATKHQFFPKVSAHIVAGDAKSGLLPGVSPDLPDVDGSGDRKVQAYNLRMCLTDVARNRRRFEKPEGYDELDYELLLRNFESGLAELPWHSLMMPNRKTDTNNNTGFSTDFIGESYRWAESTWDERKAIYQRHRHYQEGLMWTVQNHPRVPDAIRKQALNWGNALDEFDATDGWSPQLYVREARRLVGSVVMTEHHCRGKSVAADSIGMAAYTMDSHNVQRYVDREGFVRNEGDVQVGGFPPYPISYGSILPKRQECENLLVPVCLSCSHIAYGSIRMEPVFMVLGQSAAIAASLSKRSGKALHDVPYSELRTALVEANQVI